MKPIDFDHVRAAPSWNFFAKRRRAETCSEL
jgi:hypothetical protein